MTRSIELLVITAAVALIGCSGDGHTHENNDHHHDDSGAHSDDTGHSHHGDADHHHQPQPDAGTADLGPDVTITPAAYDYCECMLLNCHDPFHDRWGVDDADATTACAAEASSWPVAGSPQTSGDSFECRQHHCDEVAAGNSTCDDALGDACQ